MDRVISIMRTKQEVFGFSDEEAKQIMLQYLAKIKNDRWADTDRHVLREEVYTSHRFDTDCDNQTDYELVATIQKLEDLLKARK